MAVIKKIKFLDLYQQSLPIKNQIRKKINSCIRESNFINGKEVNLFQNSFNYYFIAMCSFYENFFYQKL